MSLWCIKFNGGAPKSRTTLCRRTVPFTGISHFTYDSHNCTSAYRKNVQVPVCPLCNKPVPTPKNVSPDVQVNEHILNNCLVRTKKKVFSNKCTFKGCRRKEVVPITCPSCKKNFCLTHRHESDHQCVHKINFTIPGRAVEVMARNQGKQNCASQARTSVSLNNMFFLSKRYPQYRLQQLSEDEALARALADSFNDNIGFEERDRSLAEQLQQQEYNMNMDNDVRRRNQRLHDTITGSCSIS
ncbi:hypothetical protein DICVIV_00068 [Dictyocaulus viviparus]|uniref:AN1-type domain-containing protein n=1 Tax=Dictyocaulus viviparus TaxID=29172 RepID=A0A0D8YA50_DICVI|nr:hypothetical protein DICVIV_00068 [Dictyocaulus viviparus]